MGRYRKTWEEMEGHEKTLDDTDTISASLSKINKNVGNAVILFEKQTLCGSTHWGHTDRAGYLTHYSKCVSHIPTQMN